ncbi:hypothetical protein VIGAN_08368800, partial [Vigna angularis var. angularis]
MRLYYDNKFAISITHNHNPVQLNRTKCIEVVKHFIKEKLDSGLINTSFVSTQNNLIDMNCITFERIIIQVKNE